MKAQKFKTIIFIISLSFFHVGMFSQNTYADLENYILLPNSIMDGGTDPIDGHIDTGWVSGNCFFTCRVHFNVWDRGFAISNYTDSTLFNNPNNPYSLLTSKPLTGGAIPNGGGVMSQNYLLCKADLVYSNAAMIKFLSPCVPQSICLTNTCFGYDAMKNGNNMNKIPKFGGTTGDDPDWLKVTFRKYLGGILTNDSVEHFLADYRFSQNNLDFIQAGWQCVNLTSLGQADSLLIYARTSKESEIMSLSGDIVGATMFCVDNVETNVGPLAVRENELNASIIYPNPATKELYADLLFKPEIIKVFNNLGMKVLSSTSFPLNINELGDGIYFVQIFSEKNFITKKIIIKR